jgi:peptidylprolyl isomerase
MLKWMSVLLFFIQPMFAEEAKPMTTTTKTVVLETNEGSLELNLMPDVAPKTCENFIGLVNKGYYNGVIFHRVIKDFMIQGGDPTGTGRGGDSFLGGKFKDEFSNKVFSKPGILAMANAGPNTNGSQFFITTAATPWLNNKHTIFGEIAPESMEVLRKIEKTNIGPGDRPVNEIKIVKAYLK